jgi:hypothetical protein
MSATVEFFNFGNDQTFHFFTWLCKSGLVDLQQLIRDALNDADESPDALEREEGYSDLAVERLAYRLEDSLNEQLINVIPDHLPPDGPYIAGECSTLNDLWMPLLSHAVHSVDCYKVAEALLIRARKALCGPGDSGESVLTVLLPHED